MLTEEQRRTFESLQRIRQQAGGARASAFSRGRARAPRCGTRARRLARALRAERDACLQAPHAACARSGTRPATTHARALTLKRVFRVTPRALLLLLSRARGQVHEADADQGQAAERVRHRQRGGERAQAGFAARARTRRKGGVFVHATEPSLSLPPSAASRAAPRRVACPDPHAALRRAERDSCRKRTDALMHAKSHAINHVWVRPSRTHAHMPLLPARLD